jgi:hypothetical protein
LPPSRRTLNCSPRARSEDPAPGCRAATACRRATEPAGKDLAGKAQTITNNQSRPLPGLFTGKPYQFASTPVHEMTRRSIPASARVNIHRPTWGLRRCRPVLRAKTQILSVSHLLPDSLTPIHPAASPVISMTSNWSSIPMYGFSRSLTSAGV